jgi:ribonucleoside-triphosphate reductase
MAESLCYLQVQQFRKKYGIVENVSDREYISNSFHCHVTEDITPIQKQDLEYRFWNYFNGGKIQYCKYPINYNKKAVITLIRRAMDMGFYEGVNLSLAYCEKCGYEELDMDVCPKCGSREITKVDRMNGYLGYTRVHGDTRYNKGKMAEIKDRVSM